MRWADYLLKLHATANQWLKELEHIKDREWDAYRDQFGCDEKHRDEFRKDLTGATQWTAPEGLEQTGGNAFRATKPGYWTIRGRVRVNGVWKSSYVEIEIR